MNRFIHTVNVDYSNTPAIYTQDIEFPANAVRLVGIAPFHTSTLNGTNANEIEILLNDERNHFAASLPVAGSSSENNSGFISVNYPIIPGTIHRIILNGVGSARIAFLFETH